MNATSTHAYAESFPEYWLVEVMEHLVHIGRALLCVEIAHNLNEKQTPQLAHRHCKDLPKKQNAVFCRIPPELWHKQVTFYEERWRSA